LLNSLEAEVVWPRRQLTIRKQGVEKNALSPIFPGYVFLSAETLPTELYWKIRRTEGFYRFLKNNQEIEPLGGKDRNILLHFLSFGEVVAKSEAFFDENQRIVVVQGPMKGLEGSIEKVNRRRKRAKIRLSLYKDSFLVDFGFDIIEAVKNSERD
jgi:transcriptional antiterminator NusG